MDKKYQKLLLSIGLDLIGLIPIPFIDVIWAPLSAFIMTRMYAGAKGKIAGLISFIEEIIPFTDVIPTFTILWIYTNLIERPKEKETELQSFKESK
jgi:putative exporter of polyketide antibiotics